MRILTTESQEALANHITSLVRQEVQQEAELAEQVKLPGVRFSQELVRIRAQLAALRWIQATEPNPSDWKVRRVTAEQQAAAVEQFRVQLISSADEPTRAAAYDLLVCLHGQSSIFNWA